MLYTELSGIETTDLNGVCFPIITLQTLQHFTLIPCCLVILVLHVHLYLSNKKIVLQVPFSSLVDNDRNREMVVLAFGALTSMIIQTMFHILSQGSPSDSFGEILEKVVLFFVSVFVKAVTNYPIFACISLTTNKCVVSLLGGFYVLWQLVALLLNCTNVTCNGITRPKAEFIAIEIVRNFSALFCLSALLFQFGKRSYKAYKHTFQQKLTANWESCVANKTQTRHVRLLLAYSRNALGNSESLPWYLKLRRIIRDVFYGSNFKYSTLFSSAMIIVVMACYQIAVMIIVWHLRRRSGLTDSKSILYIDTIFAVAFIETVVIYVWIILHFMSSHQRIMLDVFRGKRNTRIEEEMLKITPRQHIRSNLMFPGFLVAHMVWGFFVFFSISVGVFNVVLYYVFNINHELFLWLLKNLIVVGFVPFVIYIVETLLVHFIFTSRSDILTAGSNVSLRHAMWYHSVIYINFFFNIIVGLMSSLKRSSVSFTISLLFMGRLDRTSYVFFTQFDSGYQAYLAYLYMQKIYKNPSMRCFCQILFDSVAVCSDKKITTVHIGELDSEQKPKVQRKCSKVARNRWFLAFTLINNPSLRKMRCADSQTTNRSTSFKINL